jgi:hypothetical protein
VVAKAGKNHAAKHGKQATSASLSDDEDEEESWTFVGTGDDFDPELVVKKSALADAEQVARSRGVNTSLGDKILGSLTTTKVATPASP